MDHTVRYKLLAKLQEHFADFSTLLNFVMNDVLHFGDATDIQQDIGSFLHTGGDYLMVMAQRGQAKTTITACYAVYHLIHNPKARVVIVSAGDQMASDIAVLINQIIMNTHVFECLRPEASAGQRTSSKRFDLHYSLKGIDKSPSVCSLGVTSNIQGYRADLLIGDDIESSKNSASAVQREVLVNRMNDFSSICSNGRIILLGTPQTGDSVYNNLPARGCNVRIWTGRYPNSEEMPTYSGLLAPMLVKRLEADPLLSTGYGLTGDSGAATDPHMFDEEALIAKETRQGTSHFQLQYMLNTAMLDKDRYPLKPSDIMFMDLPQEKVYASFVFGRDAANVIPDVRGSAIIGTKLYRPLSYDRNTLVDYTGCHMYIDPAGGGANGDETGYAITRFCNGYVFVMAVGGVHGGIDRESLNALADIAVIWKPNIITVEDNFGAGMFTKVFTPIVPERATKAKQEFNCRIEGDWAHGQKELRIIDTLEPLFGTHRIIFNESILQSDVSSVQKYPVDKRSVYQLMHQIKHITRERGSLMHDDKLDALAGSCKFWIDRMAIDEKKAAEEAKKKNWTEFVAKRISGRGKKPQARAGRVSRRYG